MKCVSLSNPEHQSLIKSQYDDVKANEQDFQELIKQTDEFNAQATSVSVPVRIAIYQKQMKALQKLCDWFLKEYKTHIMLFFSAEAKELVKRVGSYHNSARGMRFMDQLSMKSEQAVELSFHDIIIFEGTELKCRV
ncbi:hypothetical protein A0J61_11921 [Choanephora cucurbitarum]|uniref:Uncharacterized protein n=1 Tax=Choanephora cucurbitarum TaxID=101091 RepID=A0A1C7LPG2_9FUNG|nr:hypothetical protein A0J61_11921 [Choanephora cucurbitarum]